MSFGLILPPRQSSEAELCGSLGDLGVRIPQQEAILWKPERPQDNGGAVQLCYPFSGGTPVVPDRQGSVVRLNMDFGGPTGDGLTQLNRIVALINPFTAQPVGFPFVYESIFLGELDSAIASLA